MAISEFRSVELLDIGTLSGETVTNDAIQNLSRGISGYLAIDLTGWTLYELASDDDDLSLYATLRFTGTLAANCDVVAPARARVYILENLTTGAFSLTIKTSAGTGIVLAAGTRTLCYSDAINIYPVVSNTGSLPAASDTVPGISRFGTDAEDIAGTLRTVAVHPAGLKAALLAQPGPPAATLTVAGIAPLASAAEALTGTNATKIVTPSTLQAKINALPLASSTVVGLAEAATPAEAITGTDPSRFVTPQGLKAVVDTLPVTPITGTPLSLLRIPASGTGQQGNATLLTDQIERNLGLAALQMQETGLRLKAVSTGQPQVSMVRYGVTGQGPTVQGWMARGTDVAPLPTQDGDVFLRIAGRGNDGGDWVGVGQTMIDLVGAETQSATTRGSRIIFYTTDKGAAAQTERVRMDEWGNLTVGAPGAGVGLRGGLVLKGGSAPTSGHPPDAVQIWAGDRAGTAGKGSLLLRTEDGTSHVLGDRVGIGTLTPQSDLEVAGTVQAGYTGINSAPEAGYALTVQGAQRIRAGALSVLREDGGQATVNLTEYGAGLARLQTFIAGGTEALPTATAANRMLLEILGLGHDGSSFPAAIRVGLQYLTTEAWTPTTQGTTLRFLTTITGGVNSARRLEIDGQGNLCTWSAVAGTDMQAGLVMKNGTAPTGGHPADAVQLWAADVEGLGGQAGLHIRSESGALYRFSFGFLYRNYPLGLATQTVAAPYVATVDDSGKVFMATNATAMVAVLLPTTFPAGIVYEGLNHVSQGLRFRASGSAIIRHGSASSAAGGAIEVAAGAGNVGATLRLLAINTGVWQVMSFTGTWTLIA